MVQLVQLLEYPTPTSGGFLLAPGHVTPYSDLLELLHQCALTPLQTHIHA